MPWIIMKRVSFAMPPVEEFYWGGNEWLGQNEAEDAIRYEEEDHAKKIAGNLQEEEKKNEQKGYIGIHVFTYEV